MTVFKGRVQFTDDEFFIFFHDEILIFEAIVGKNNAVSTRARQNKCKRLKTKEKSW